MPALTIYTNPLFPGICQMPAWYVGDSQNWSLQFSDGVNLYDPTGVTLAIGYVKGLDNLTYSSAFRFVDRMNNQHVGSVVVAAGVPGTLAFDENPIGVEGNFGAWLLRGRIPPSGTVRSVYVKYGGTAISTAPKVRFDNGSTSTGKGATATVAISAGGIGTWTVTNGGIGYSTTTPPEVVVFGDGTGGTATATVTAGKVTSIATTTAGSGYTAATGVIRDPEATATATVGGTSTVSGVTVNNPGAGYTIAPTVAFTGGGGASAAATAALAISTWGLAGLTITGAGSGYSTPPTISFTGGTGSGAAATAIVTPSGVLTRIAVTNPGYYQLPVTSGISYTVAVQITPVSGGTGAVGTAIVTVTDTGVLMITGVTLTAGGSGYLADPTISFTVGSYAAVTTVIAATATAHASTGEVTAIALTNPGTGYGATAPTVVFSSGAASATAQLVGSPISPVITMTNNGSGYTSPPVVSFSSGGGTGAAGVAIVALGITAITVVQGGFAYSSLPSISLIPNNGAVLSASGVESHSIPFLQDINPASSGGAISLTPFTNGRRDTAGALVYDDGLLIVRPRYVQQPTLTRQADGLTWAGVFAPVNTFVTTLLAYQRTVVLDFEVWGGGRLLLQTKLRVLKP